MIITLVRLIQIFGQALTLLVIAHVLLSYFMSPMHPVRQAVDRLVEPLLSPIRNLIPSVGMFDLSPLVLLILVQLLVSLVSNLLLSF